MKKRYRRLLISVMAVLIGAAVLAGFVPKAQMNAQASAEGTDNGGRILFISSYSYAWDTVQVQIEGLKKGISGNIVLDYEFMDTKRVSDETSYQLFYEGLAYRLSKVDPYDVIILGDDAAFDFALDHKDDLFAGIPLVFEGVNDIELAMEAASDPMITGVVEKLSFQKNIELALSIYPDATRVVEILDDTVTGQAERKNFYQNAELYPNLEFSEINASELTTKELKSALKKLDENTILIYVVMTEDASGKQYSNRESIEMISQYSPIPAFRMVDGGNGLGYGILGGNIASMELSGEIAAGIAVDIITGARNVADIEVVDSPNIYWIDEEVMRQFGIDKELLPKDTVFANHELSFAERNEEIFIPIVIFLGALLVIIVWICIDNVKKRRLTEELEEARMFLEDASQHDFLTGLSNRSKFMSDLGELIDKRVPCTVIMMDVDNFKHINDTYGHAIGDEALKQVAARLKVLKTQLFTPYRFAGDEFIMILKSDNAKIVDTTAMQCLQIFTKSFKLTDKVHNIHGSIGVASYPQDCDNGEQLIVCADAAMYQVKKSGKNAYGYYKDVKQ